MENNTYDLTKLLIETYKNLRKETPNTHKFLAKARNLFFASKEPHLTDSDIEFLNEEMHFLEKSYNEIFIKNSQFSNLTEIELEDIKKNLEFIDLGYSYYEEFLKFFRIILLSSILFAFYFIFRYIYGENISNFISFIFTMIFIAFLIVIFFGSIPQRIVDIQAKRNIFKEIDILIDKRILQLRIKCS